MKAVLCPFEHSGFEPADPLGMPARAVSLVQRYLDSAEALGIADQLERGDFGADADAAVQKLLMSVQRGITSSITAFPVRENLEAEAVVLTPVETPLRNMLPRVPGSGLAVKWKQLTAFGAGLGTATTTSGTTNSANTLVCVNVRGFFLGEQFLYASTLFTITAIDYSTNIISVASGIGGNSQTNGQTVVKTSMFFPESGTPVQMFYSEAGAPIESTETYADKNASYKLLGDMGSVTLFAMAAGANFQNQYMTAKRNCLVRTMLKEEFALMHGNSAATNAPWGDGTNALAYGGLVPFIIANAPSNQIQSSVGTFTVEHVQSQLARIWYQGGRRRFIMINGQEALSFAKLMTGSGNYRIIVEERGSATVGVKVAKLIAAVGGDEVDIYTTPFLPIGMMVFGSMTNTWGNPSAQVSVLPQVMDQPGTTFNDNIQGYYAQDIAPAAAAPEKLLFKIGLYSVPEWRNANVWAISTGVTSA